MDFKRIREGETYIRLNQYSQPIARVIVTYKNDKLVQFICADSGMRDNLSKYECKKYLR